MTQDNSKLTTICTKTTDHLNRLICWLKTIFHWLKGLRIASNSVPIADEEPVFNPDKAKTREEVEAYVDQYVEDSIAWQEREFKKWKLENITLPLHDPSRVKQRRRQVWKWSAVSFSMLCFLVYSGILPISQRLQEILIFEWLPNFWFAAPPVQNLPNAPLFFSIVALLITAPIAYAIWTLRDENAAQTLENARKDTNLKDFQRLSEWASGFHLPEDKIVSLDKIISKETEMTNETSTTTETYAPPKDAQQISRRMDAESLQVAAIYQLQAFMRGVYGEQFMKPAFHLLHSIWEGLMRPLLPLEDQILDEEYVKITRKKIEEHHQKPIYKAVNYALVGDGGMTLRLFNDESVRLFLAGIVSEQSEVYKTLNLAGLNLHMIDLRFCLIRDSNFVGTNFSNAKMSGADIQSSDLSMALIQNQTLSNSCFSKNNMTAANFRNSKINQSIFFDTNLNYSNFCFASISSCNFTNSKLKNSSLVSSKINKCILTWSNLTSANLKDCDIDLENSDVRNCQIGAETHFGKSILKSVYPEKPQECEGEWGQQIETRRKWVNAGAIFSTDDTD